MSLEYKYVYPSTDKYRMNIGKDEENDWEWDEECGRRRMMGMNIGRGREEKKMR
jgi:hypothetical protein